MSAPGGRGRREIFYIPPPAAVVAEAFEVEARSRARRARARKPQDDARAVFEEDANPLSRRHAAVNGVCVAEVVRARDEASSERHACERRKFVAQAFDHF